VGINPVTTSSAAPAFRWSDDFLVGVAEIDEQHRRLFQMIDGFYAALREKRPASEALADLLDGLVEYTRYHFATEERLMARTGFPDSPKHREQHAGFVSTVDNLVDRVSTGQLVLSLEATSFLREWLVNHILKSDKELGGHLITHGMG
jgi:hemerythrin